MERSVRELLEIVDEQLLELMSRATATGDMPMQIDVQSTIQNLRKIDRVLHGQRFHKPIEPAKQKVMLPDA